MLPVRLLFRRWYAAPCAVMVGLSCGALAPALASGCDGSTEGALVDSPDAAVDASESGTWRSALYPEDWTPSFTAPDGSFLHDFSYAGYHRSERELPEQLPGVVVDVRDHGASPDPGVDSAPAFVAAVAEVGARGGGVVYVPPGEFHLHDDLRIELSEIVLRGAGAGVSKLRFTRTGTSGGASITFAGLMEPEGGARWLSEDAAARGHEVRLSDTEGLAIGDDVLLEMEITAEFIEEHGMTGVWDTGPFPALGTRKVMLRREIVAVSGDGVTLDVPVRAPLRVRDRAALLLDEGAIRECGVESLSINTVVDPVAAQANPRHHAIELRRAQDCFVRDVHAYASAHAPDAHHFLQSGGVFVVSSKRITVAGSTMGRSQNRGSGGAGYGFEASASNEVLFRDLEVHEVRHGLIQNWDFGASGLVWLRCRSRDNVMQAALSAPGRSEYHHRLATACLFDSTFDSAGFNAINRHTESSHAGHTATESVFWNVSGAGSHSELRSFQFGRGYAIGTTELGLRVEPDEFDALLSSSAHTEPWDWVEGVDQGGQLVPSSLFEDQLARRSSR